MKKVAKNLKYLIITIVLLFSCFGFSTQAAASAFISDDYRILTIGDVSYSRFNISDWDVSYDIMQDNPIVLTADQREVIHKINLWSDTQQTVMHAEIYFKDGAYLSIGFLRDDYLEMYTEYLNNETDEYLINFYWPDNNQVKTNKEYLFGSPVTLYTVDLESCDYYPVILEESDIFPTIYKGALIIINENYYYTDFETGTAASWDEFNPNYYSSLEAYEITDSELIKNIKDGITAFYGDSLGFLYDDDFTEAFSAIFLVFVFAIIPLVIFIVFFILLLRSKNVYQKIFAAICIFSGAELAVFAIIASFIISNH